MPEYIHRMTLIEPKNLAFNDENRKHVKSYKDRCFQDTAGTIPANIGDKVALVLNTPPPIFDSSKPIIIA